MLLGVGFWIESIARVWSDPTGQPERVFWLHVQNAQPDIAGHFEISQARFVRDDRRCIGHRDIEWIGHAPSNTLYARSNTLYTAT